MKLSIIIPIYNAEKYIEQCLNTITNEIDSSVEVILVNDGSTDNSLEICKKYSSKNIKVFNNKNKGVSFSRNFGLSKASGKWIMFVDADDLLVKGWKKAINAYFNKKADLVFFSKNIDKKVYSKEEMLSYITNYKKNRLFFSSVWSKLYSRDFLEKNNLKFDEKLINGEDMIFNIECVLLSNNYLFCNESIYSFRINSSSSTHTFNPNYINSDKQFQKVIKKLFDNDSDIDYKLKNNIANYLIENAKINIAYRLSLSKKYRIFFQNKDVFNDYKNPHGFKFKRRISLKIVLFLLDKKMFRIVFYIFNLKRILRGREYFYYIDI